MTTLAIGYAHMSGIRATGNRAVATARAWLTDELHQALRDARDDCFLATEKGMQYDRRLDAEVH